MKPDVISNDDIEKIVRAFYAKIDADEVLGYFFNVVVPVDWSKHVAKMCSFWENVLFYTGDYEGNPLIKHRELNLQQHTKPEHFERWMNIFYSTLDASFEGPNVEKMKRHSKSIASVMMQKM